MAKAIETIYNKPNLLMERQSELKLFLQKFEQALNFAPDRQSGKLYGGAGVGPSETEIEETLEREFFNTLYIERGAKAEIEGYIQSQRLILLHGLMGTGKTVTLMKLSKELNEKGRIRLHYFDCKAMVENFYAEASQDFTRILRQSIYSELKKEYIDPFDENIKGWLLHKVKSDPAYTDLKEAILDVAQRSLTDDEWLKNLSTPHFQDLLLTLNVKQNLSKLLEFIKTKIPLALCFDNVDRFALDDQRKILETCIDISNNVQIPIVLSIRTPNLRRITNEGAKGDFVYMSELERIKPKYVEIIQHDFAERDKPVRNNFIDATIEQLLTKRIEFIYRHRAFKETGDQFKIILEKFNLEISMHEGVERFRRIFDLIAATFVSEDVYSICNYSIRAMLVFYFDFAAKLVLNPEPQYSIGTLLLRDREFNITKLRNYFYKWLICHEEIIPNASHCSCPNIFGHEDSGTNLLLYKILCYLENHYGFTDGVNASEMVKDFWTIGVDRAVLRKTLMDLATNQEDNDTAMIWLDYKGETIFDDGRVFLMPAGRYFLNRLALSREYVFWMALNSEFTTEQMHQLLNSDKIDFEQTYNDSFKYQTIYNYFSLVLMPFLSAELEMINSRLYPPPWWKGTPLRFFKKNFSLNNHFFQNRLLNSLLNSIEFANLTRDERQIFRNQFTELLRKVEALEK